MGRARSSDRSRHAAAPTVWARTTAGLVNAAEEGGLSRGELLAAAGLHEEDLRDPDARVPLASLYALLEVLEDLSDVPLAHMRVAQRLELSSLDALALIVLASRTLGEGFRAMLRYQRVWNDGERYLLEEDRRWAKLVYLPWGPRRRAHALMADLFAVDVLVNGARMIGAKFEGARARFIHRPPENVVLHRALLEGAEARFSQPRDEVWLPIAELSRPIAPPGREDLFAYFERNLEARLRALPPTSVGGRVRDVVLREMEREPSLAAIARRLGSSTRTVQRHLTEEGTSLRAIADEARRVRAVALLQSGSSIAEVSWALGYSEPSAFHRAFRRWTGRTPQSFRSS